MEFHFRQQESLRLILRKSAAIPAAANAACTVPTAAGTENAGSNVPHAKGYWRKKLPFHMPKASGSGSTRSRSGTAIQIRRRT